MGLLIHYVTQSGGGGPPLCYFMVQMVGKIVILALQRGEGEIWAKLVLRSLWLTPCSIEQNSIKMKNSLRLYFSGDGKTLSHQVYGSGVSELNNSAGGFKL